MPTENSSVEEPSDKEETGASSLLNRVIDPLYQSRFWMQLFAGCLIFYGALITVTGIGVLVAWIPIWIGVLLMMVSKSLAAAYQNNDEDALLRSVNRLKTIFTILGLCSVMLIVASFYLFKYAIDNSLF